MHRHSWTAKEAAYKALYPHYKLRWKDMTIRKVDKKPCISVTFPVQLHLSVSHDNDMMTAFVVAESKE